MFNKRLSFPPEARIRKRPEFNHVYKMGCKLNTPHFLIILLKTSNLRSRLGITVSKKVGNAVIRNRVKRIIRNFFRINQNRFLNVVDVSVIAKRGTGNVANNDIWNELEQLFK